MLFLTPRSRTSCFVGPRRATTDETVPCICMVGRQPIPFALFYGAVSEAQKSAEGWIFKTGLPPISKDLNIIFSTGRDVETFTYCW